MFAAILGSEHAAALAAQIGQRSRAAFITLNNGHDDIWFARGYCQSDPAGLRWKSTAQLLPGCATVRALKDSTNVFAVRRSRPGNETPGRSLPRVKCRVNDLRITRIESDVAAAGPRVMRRGGLQDQLPNFSTIRGFVEA